MQWLEHLNHALDYIEDNLGGDISYEHAAKLACCSSYQFQRIFSYVASVPLAEYIRRRRLTMAALALQNGSKVVDVSLASGYDSPTAFTRAFKALHGITPSQAKVQGVTLIAYPRIAFKLSIKGEANMEYSITKKDAFRIVGVRVAIGSDFEKNMVKIPEFWSKTHESGTIPILCNIMEGSPGGVLGVSIVNEEKKEGYYYIGVASGAPAPANMYEYTIPAGTWAIFKGHGKMPQAIQETEKRIYSEWLPTSGYEWANAPDIEVYPDPPGEDVRYEVWIPIVKK